METGVIESLITHIHKSEGCRQFAPYTELEGGSKKLRRVEAHVRGVHGVKISRSTIEEVETRASNTPIGLMLSKYTNTYQKVYGNITLEVINVKHTQKCIVT
jgi:hypothetical protein